MINYCLIYRLNFTVPVPQNPNTWVKDLLGKIAQDIMDEDTEDVEIIPSLDCNIELPSYSSKEPMQCTTVHIYGDLPYDTYNIKSVIQDTGSRLLQGHGVIDCIQAIGSSNPIISLHLA